MTDSPVLARVRELVTPIASDLELEIYDVEQRGGTLRVTLDTPPGSETGVTLDKLALASRLVSRELDEQDPVPGRYTLEVTSPGVERTLRVPAHFQREVGKVVAIRLSDVGHDDRRITGELVAADETAATIRPEGAADADDVVRVEYQQIDRARTVFVWGGAEKPGAKKPAAKKPAAKKVAAKKSGAEQPAGTPTATATETAETAPADETAAATETETEHEEKTAR